MKDMFQRKHSVENLFSVMLFGLFVLLLLLMLLFSTLVYRTAVEGADENNNLRTAQNYITTKFRQHDAEGMVFLETLQGQKALCFKDVIEDEEYITYIYLKDNELKELFTASRSDAPFDMGTALASLVSFEARQTEEGYFRITMEDARGARCVFLLHPGPPENTPMG